MARDKRSVATDLVNPWPKGQLHEISFIRSLLDRNVRDDTKLLWAEGYRNLHCALSSKSDILNLVICPQLLRSNATRVAINHIAQTRTTIVELNEQEFLALSTHQEPQGVGMVARQQWGRLIDVQPGEEDIWIVLDNVRTPGNVGTILRTCAAVNARGVMFVGGEADPFDPSSVRASMGAIFHQNLIRTSAKALIGWRKRHPCTIVGTSPTAPLHYRKADLRGPLLLVMGNERSGVRERQAKLCDCMVRIPCSKFVDSLNLAIATGVLLYEAYEQRCICATPANFHRNRQ